MKRLFVFLLSMVLLLSLVGCKSDEPVVNFDGPVFDISKNENDKVTIPTLELEQKPFAELFAGNRLYGDSVIINAQHIKDNWTLGDSECHLILCNLKKNDKFVITEKDGAVEIGWGDGKSNIHCFAQAMQLWDNFEEVHQNTMLMSNVCDSSGRYQYMLFAPNEATEGVSEYTIVVNLSCSKCLVMMQVSFDHNEWKRSDVEDYDKLIGKVAMELVEQITLYCTCCDSNDIPK